MHLHDRAGTLASLLLYKVEKPSVRTVTLLSQSYQHVLKPDLLDMKAESSVMTKYVFKSLHVRLPIHTNVQKALV